MKKNKCRVCKKAPPIVGTDLCPDCTSFKYNDPNETDLVTFAADKSLLFNIASSFEDMDVVTWCEKYVQLPDSDAKFTIRGVGREYLVEPIKYMSTEALQRDGQPTVILKGRQVGMSVTMVSTYLFLINCGLYNNLRILHAFPSLLPTSEFNRTKIEPMIFKADYIRRRRYSEDTMDFSETSKKLNAKPKACGTWTDHLKEFQGNNMLSVNATAKDASRLRGQTFHVILFDEVQDMTRKAIENVEETLTMSPYGPPGIGVRVYFGTPFLEGSSFHSMWESSDQRYYHPHCHTCGKNYEFYTYGSDKWDEIWISGYTFKCPLCGALEDKVHAMKDGEWVSYNPEGKKRGYHFNQLYTPGIPKEAILLKRKDKLPQQFKNEVLGEFYGGVLSSESYRDLVLSCASENESYLDFIEPYINPVVALGVDWGGKVDERSLDGSWTVALVMTQNEGKYYVRHMERLETKNPQEQIARIKTLFSKYAIVQAVGDMGYGQDKVWDLQSEYGRRFMGCHSVQSKNVYTFNDKSIPPFISVNKDMVIDELLANFRSGKIVLPYKTEKDQMLTEILAAEISGVMPSEKLVSGARIRTYVRRGSQTIDSLMALMYAYIALRFKVSGGFTSALMQSYGGNRYMPIPRRSGSISRHLINRMSGASVGSGPISRHKR